MDVSPLLPAAYSTGRRVRLSGPKVSDMTPSQRVALLLKCWNKARIKGSASRGGDNWSPATARHQVIGRLRRVMGEIPHNDRRWANRDPDHVKVRIESDPTRIATVSVKRKDSKTTKKHDKYLETHNHRGDTAWCVKFYQLFLSLTLEFNTNPTQNHYIAICALIDVINVSYGFHPGSDIRFMPEDLGFNIPNGLPTFT